MDRGAWQATIHSVTKSWTQLKQLSTSQAMGRASLGPSREVGLPGHPCTYSPCFLWPRVSSMRLQLSTPSQAMCESILHSTPQHLVPGLGVDRLMGGKPIISLFRWVGSLLSHCFHLHTPRSSRTFLTGVCIPDLYFLALNYLLRPLAHFTIELFIFCN